MQKTLAAACLLASAPTAFGWGLPASFSHVTDQLSDAAAKMSQEKEKLQCSADAAQAALQIGTCLRETKGDCKACAASFEQATANCAEKFASVKKMVDTAKPGASCESVSQLAADTAAKDPLHSCAAYACDTAFTETHKCHCTDECEAYGNCCDDYAVICKSKALGADANEAFAKAQDTAKHLQDKASAETTAAEAARKSLADAAKDAEVAVQAEAEKAKNEATQQLQHQAKAMTNVGEQVQAHAQAAVQAAEAQADAAKEAVSQAKANGLGANVQAALQSAEVQAEAAGHAVLKADTNGLDVHTPAAMAQVEGAKDDVSRIETEVAENSIENMAKSAKDAIADAKGLSAQKQAAVKAQADQVMDAALTAEGQVAADAKDALAGVNGVGAQEHAVLQEHAQAANDALTSVFDNAAEVKQCGSKALSMISTAKECVAEDHAKICDCIAEFNASMRPCAGIAAAAGSADALEQLPGAAACSPQALADLKGKLQFTVSDPMAFLNKAGAPKAIQDAVAKLAGLKDSKYVSAILKQLSSSTLTARRLAGDANMQADWTIAMPESAPAFADLGAVAEKLRASAAEVQGALQDEITAELGTNFTVSGASQVVSLNGDDGQPVAPADPQPAPLNNDESQFMNLAWYWYALGAVGIMALIAGVVMCAMSMQDKTAKNSKKKRAAKASAPTAAPADAPAMQQQQLQRAPLVPQPLMMQAPAPVPTQAYQMPVYYPAQYATAQPAQHVVYPAYAPATYAPASPGAHY